MLVGGMCSVLPYGTGICCHVFKDIKHLKIVIVSVYTLFYTIRFFSCFSVIWYQYIA